MTYSSCGNYDQLWGTTSLRGIVNDVLTVEVLSATIVGGAFTAGFGLTTSQR